MGIQNILFQVFGIYINYYRYLWVSEIMNVYFINAKGDEYVTEKLLLWEIFFHKFKVVDRACTAAWKHSF